MKYIGLLGALITTVVACGGKQGTPSGETGGTTGGSSTSAGSNGMTGGNNTGGVSSGTGGSAGASGNAGASSGMGGGSGLAMGGANQGGSAAGGNGQGGSSAQAGSASVLERNGSPTRAGTWTEPALTKAAASKMAFDANFKATFTGAVWASPLYMSNGPAGKGAYFVVTTGNDVLALDETDGHTVWMTNIGSSPTSNGQGVCGSIHPLGIISTPVIDATARKLYVAGAIGTSSISKHEIHQIAIEDGSDAKAGGWPVDVTTMSAGSLMFSAATMYQNQRSALSLVNGILYVTYGGHVGDCGNYHGWVIAVDTSDATKTGAWATGGGGEAVWAPGGLPSDGASVFAVTGNNTDPTAPATHLDSEEVIRLTGLAAVDKSSNKNVFFPTRWQAMDGANDYDLGASNALYLEVPGATPSKYVVALAKDGHMYMLDAGNLGGLGGQVVDFKFAGPTEGMLVRTVPATYTDSAGAHVVLTTETAGLCPGANPPKGRVIMSVLIPAGAPPAPQVEWCAPIKIVASSSAPTPIVTTTDGHADPIVWIVNNSQLTGLDAATGTALFTSGDTCPGVRQWTSPIAVKGRIVVGADNNLCIWSPH